MVAHEPCPQVRLPNAGRTGCSPLSRHLVSSVTESYCSRHVGYPLNRERVFLLRTKSGSATIVKDEVSIGTLRARRGREEELWHSSSSLGASSRPQRMIVLWHSGLVGCCIYMSQVVLETRVLLARTARWPGANREVRASARMGFLCRGSTR